ncbi:MAG: sarcosine oxidase subunit gamma family protein [Dehalococcoidia bacterium]
MPDFAPVARSPIELPPPLTVVEGWEVSARRSSSALLVVDCSPLAKVLVRAAPNGEAARALGVPFGRAQRDAARNLVVGSAPGEWLLLGPPSSESALLDRGEALTGSEFVSVVDVTHSRALIRLTGADTARLLVKVCAIDLDDSVTPDGAAFRSWVANVVTDVVRDDQDGIRSYLLHCDRSSGQYLFDAVTDAGTEFDIDVDGFRTPGI